MASQSSPFSELAVQATSEVLPLEPQDLQNATALCEVVYWPDEVIPEQLEQLTRLLGLERPLTDVSVHDAAGQRYMVGHSPTAMYVAFQGTKHVRDWVANLSFRHSTMWEDDPAAQPPAAHGGFSGRSVGVPLEELYERAAASNRRLVLCGHSLGGAVALLCTIKLLRVWAAKQLGTRYCPGGCADGRGGEKGGGAGRGGRRGGGGGGGRQGRRQGRRQRERQHLAAAAAAAAKAPFADPSVRCITFAAPAVANEALAAEVVAAGWDRLMTNLVQPEDVVVSFVNKLLKAEEGSAALERTLLRLVSAAALPAAGPGRASAAAPSPAASSQAAAPPGDAAPALRILGNLLASGRLSCLADRLGRLGRGGGGGLGQIGASLSRAASAAAAAVMDGEDSGDLHSRLLEDSAYKETAAAATLSMASAFKMPAAETLGNAPHAPEAAARLRRSEAGAGAGVGAGAGMGARAGAGGAAAAAAAARPAGGAAPGGLLAPASALQAGLRTEALVAAATEAGSIGIRELDLYCQSMWERAPSGEPGRAGWHDLHDQQAPMQAQPDMARRSASSSGAPLTVVNLELTSPEHEQQQQQGQQEEQQRQRQRQQRQLSRRMRRAKSASEFTSADVRRVAFALSESGGGGGGGSGCAGGEAEHQGGFAACEQSISALGLRASKSMLALSSLLLPQQAQQQHQPAEAEAQARAAALMQRHAPSLRQRLLWHSARAAALAAPTIASGAAAALPAAPAASLIASLLPAGLAAAAAPAAALAAPLLGVMLPWLLALPPAAVGVELIGSLIVTFAVPRTYTVGQQWVITGQGMEPALKPLDKYTRDWRHFGLLGGLFPGHRMVAYRSRLIKLLPGERLLRLPSKGSQAQAVGDGGGGGGTN